MSDVMLCWILCSALVQKLQHLLFQRMRIHAFSRCNLVEDVAHKVAVIEFVHQLAVDLCGQMLVPFGVVTAQRDIQRQNIFHFIGMYGLITNRRASRRKAMQNALLPSSGVQAKKSPSAVLKTRLASFALQPRRHRPF